MTRLILLLCVPFLGSCATATQPLTYYLLESRAGPASERSEADAAEITLRLQELRLAHYLAQSNLTLLHGEHGVYYTSSHVWAEPLQYGIRRALAQDIAGPRVRLAAADEPTQVATDYALRLQVDNFSATDTSTVLLVGKFWILKGGKLVAGREFNLNEALTADGYEHAVAKQRQLISRLAQLIQGAIAVADE